MEPDIEDLLKTAKLLWEKSPDEIRLQTPVFLSALSNVGIVIMQNDKIKSVQDLIDHLKKDTCLDEEMSRTLVSDVKVQFVMNNSDGIVKALGSNSIEKRVFYIKGIQKDISAGVKIVLIMTAISSFLFLTIEAYSLYNFWEEISNIRNSDMVTDGKKQLITESLNKVFEQLKVLDDFVNKLLENPDDGTIKFKALCEIDDIRRMLNDLQNEINDLKFDVEKNKERLGSLRKVRMGSVVATGIQGTSGLATAVALRTSGGPELVAINILFSVIQFGLMGANIVFHSLTKKDFEKLQSRLVEIRELENQRKKMADYFENLANQIKKCIKED